MTEKLSCQLTFIIVWVLTLVGEMAFAIQCAMTVAGLLIEKFERILDIPSLYRQWRAENGTAWQAVKTRSKAYCMLGGVLTLIVVNAVGNGKLEGQGIQVIRTTLPWAGVCFIVLCGVVNSTVIMLRSTKLLGESPYDREV